MGGGNDQLGGLLRQFQQMQTSQIPQQPGRAQALGTGMGQFGAMPSYYQPPAYQPAIFQPPQLAPANQQLQQPMGLFGGYNTNGGFMGGVDDWRSPTTGGTGG